MKLKLLQQKSFKKILIIGLVILLSLTGLAFTIPYYGKKLSQETLSHFYQRSADAITVFTGDQGRIESAFQLAKKMPNSKLLITGVHNNNSLETLANSQIDSLTPESLIKNYSHLVEIDYEAKNTIENVLTTLIYARQNQTTKEIIIVSSDYHLPRIKLILSVLQESHDDTEFYYFAVPTTTSDLKNIKRYYKEIFRLIKSTILLTLWE